MIRLALPLIALAATGCKSDARPETPPPAVPGVECNSNGLESLIGRAQSRETTAEAKRLSGAKLVRYLTPGMMVTMEFRPDRLNLHLGTDGKIGSARCG
ncbi:I78 family peptidase inhibitor [Sphingomonas soli]|uniref:I78 family peptidase inhibitor n=1 Tax=Sphingomonas soli TaxID=266127 RepID=UPI00082E463C|nr:I78 family peptidase inhibitor [Sphingomonas soli]